MKHATDITKMLQGLVAKGFLVKSNYGRWTTYQLAMKVPPVSTNSMRNGDSSMRNNVNSMRNGENSMRNESLLNDPELLMISAPAREKARMPAEEMRGIIRKLCLNRHLTLAQISGFLNRDHAGIRNRYVQEMLSKNELLPLHTEPNHPQQAYKTNPIWKDN